MARSAFDHAYRRAKLAAKRLIGREPKLRLDPIEFDVAHHGDWAFCPALLGPGAIVYSGGVGKDLSLDRLFIEDFGAIVHAFDPTPAAAAWVEEQSLPKNLNFHARGLAGADGTMTLYPRVRRDGTLSDDMYTLVAEDASRPHAVDVPVSTVTTIMGMLDHDALDMLKIDVEGSEYEIIDQLLATDHRPAQLLIEFHHRFTDIPTERSADTIARLRHAGYRLADIAVTGREMTFVHRDAKSRVG